MENGGQILLGIPATKQQNNQDSQPKRLILPEAMESDWVEARLPGSTILRHNFSTELPAQINLQPARPGDYLARSLPNDLPGLIRHTMSRWSLVVTDFYPS